MSRRMLALAALLSVSTLAACTSQTGSGTAPAATAAARSGSSCTAELAEFSGIVESDHNTGNLANRVYARMKPELNRADAACRTGRDAEALKMLAATKGRYGYR